MNYETQEELFDAFEKLDALKKKYHELEAEMVKLQRGFDTLMETNELQAQKIEILNEANEKARKEISEYRNLYERALEGAADCAQRNINLRQKNRKLQSKIDVMEKDITGDIEVVNGDIVITIKGAV